MWRNSSMLHKIDSKTVPKEEEGDQQWKKRQGTE